MANSITIKSRKITSGREADFVKSFLETNNLFSDNNLKYFVLLETQAEVSVPDILIVSWDKEKQIGWDSERGKLDVTDLKILHYLSTIKPNGIITEKLCERLGFDAKIIDSTIEKLDRAKLIEVKEGKVYKKKLKDNFFLKDIVSIEAKLKKCKKVIQQADINQNFSSKSYVLVPETKNNKNEFIKAESYTGLITFDGQKAKIKKDAKRNKLPGSHFSRIINEHIGRMIYEGTSQ